MPGVPVLIERYLLLVPGGLPVPGVPVPVAAGHGAVGIAGDVEDHLVAGAPGAEGTASLRVVHGELLLGADFFSIFLGP